MRNAARIRLGYYPLPLREAERLRRYLRFPESQYSVVDPCAGCGAAAVAIAGGAPSRLYGIELDAYRAEQSSRVLNEVIQGNCFDVHCPVESFSLLYLNPPYDFEVGEGGNQRMEQLFLQQTYRWLKPSGVLLVVIPADRLMTCADVLAVHFRDKAVYRLTETESVRYQQVAVLAIRRTSRERNQVKDSDVALAKRRLADYARRYQELPALPEARRLLFSPGAGATGRPLTPLHGGHVGLLATSGLLNGVFGTGPQRHVACWESIKVTDRFEETEEGVTTIRERERFTQSLTLAYADGRTAILADRGKGDEERASTNGNTAVSQDCEGHDN
jgi:predicted RNA methylase